MTRAVLLVEDNSHKRERILAFLSELAPDLEVVQAHSFSAACQQIERSEFYLIIMDMSLPTYDKSQMDSGGRFRTFGGREVARKMVRNFAHTKILFLTQYRDFSDKARTHTIESLDRELSAECGDVYLGLVHFDSSKSVWKERIRQALWDPR